MDKKAKGLLVGLSMLLSVTSTSATVFTLNLDNEFSGATPPAGTAPWISATFDDSFGSANTVRLTMSATNLVFANQEYVSSWLFNFNPAYDPTQLTFTVVNNTAAVPSSINTGVNAFQADGDGTFDIQFDFSDGSLSDKFTAGEQVIYDITFVSAITVADFNFGSTPAGGAGTYGSAAQVLGISTTGQLYSGWIGGVPETPPGHNPEPATLALFGLGLAALGAVRRKKLAA